MGGNHNKSSFWDGVVAKIKNKLARWKWKFLSFARRICLLKFVITSLPLFYVFLFKMFAGVISTMNKIQRQILWKWGREDKKIVWVSWLKVCKLKEDRGLGVRDLRAFNLALLGKWIWRLVTKKGGLWKELLHSKYEGWRELRNTWHLKSNSLWWRDIRKIAFLETMLFGE